MYLPKQRLQAIRAAASPGQPRRPVATRTLMHVALHVNAALGSGRFDGISTLDVLDHAKSATLVEYIGQKIGLHPTFSFVTPVERRWLDAQWALFARKTSLGALGLDPQSCGLALVVAWLVELLAMRIPNA